MKDGIRVYASFSSVRKYWAAIVRDNPEMTVYQSVAWNRYVALTYKTNRYLIRSGRTRYFVLFRAGAPKILAPLAIPKDASEYISIQGQYSKAGALNLLYTQDAGKADFDELLRYVFSVTRNAEIGFYEIPSFTRFHQYLEEREDARYLFGETCVRCRVPETYEQYYSALSKSSRQTVRTARNRLQSDGKTVSVRFWRQDEHIPLSEIPKVKRLQEKRTLEKGEDGEGAAQIRPNDAGLDLYTLLYILRNELYHYILREKGAFCGVLDIDGEIAAAMIAAHQDGYVIVPYFSHDSRFDRYTPGVLLLNAFFESFCGGEIRVLDMSRGDETYKYRYLCQPEEYRADHFRISRTE